jgi:CPA1 family monovalent cation:H+ antiporter
VSIFDVAAILIAVTALSGYVNHRFLRLPPTSGTLVVALVTSLVILALEAVIPAIELRLLVERFLGEIDFDRALMQGLLCFLLFAGALHVDLEGLLDHRWTIAALATLGVLISVTVVGLLTWLMFGLIGLHISLLVCLTFGALISPTDPIAVMGLLKELRGPKSLEAQIAGESLFNDGIGVVVFMALASIAQLLDAAPVEGASINVTALLGFGLREVIGGIALGLGLGYIAYRALKSLDDHPLELLITLALVMFLYALSFWIHVSGPIAVVVAGLLIAPALLARKGFLARHPGQVAPMGDAQRD